MKLNKTMVEDDDDDDNYIKLSEKFKNVEKLEHIYFYSLIAVCFLLLVVACILIKLCCVLRRYREESKIALEEDLNSKPLGTASRFYLSNKEKKKSKKQNNKSNKEVLVICESVSTTSPNHREAPDGKDASLPREQESPQRRKTNLSTQFARTETSDSLHDILHPNSPLKNSEFLAHSPGKDNEFLKELTSENSEYMLNNERTLAQVNSINGNIDTCRAFNDQGLATKSNALRPLPSPKAIRSGKIGKLTPLNRMISLSDTLVRDKNKQYENQLPLKEQIKFSCNNSSPLIGRYSEASQSNSLTSLSSIESKASLMEYNVTRNSSDSDGESDSTSDDYMELTENPYKKARPEPLYENAGSFTVSQFRFQANPADSTSI